MTKQDYIAIAEAIVRATHEPDALSQEVCLECLGHELGLVFEADNPHFDWGVWEEAIGLEDNTRGIE